MVIRHIQCIPTMRRGEGPEDPIDRADYPVRRWPFPLDVIGSMHLGTAGHEGRTRMCLTQGYSTACEPVLMSPYRA